MIDSLRLSVGWWIQLFIPFYLGGLRQLGCTQHDQNLIILCQQSLPISSVFNDPTFKRSVRLVGSCHGHQIQDEHKKVRSFERPLKLGRRYCGGPLASGLGDLVSSPFEQQPSPPEADVSTEFRYVTDPAFDQCSGQRAGSPKIPQGPILQNYFCHNLWHHKLHAN